MTNKTRLADGGVACMYRYSVYNTYGQTPPLYKGFSGCYNLVTTMFKGQHTLHKFPLMLCILHGVAETIAAVSTVYLRLQLLCIANATIFHLIKGNVWNTSTALPSKFCFYTETIVVQY